MKLDAAAYHDIINLTTNVAVSPAEAEAWKKCLLITADEKVKIQKSQLTVNLLRKLQKRGLGLNSVEFFAKKNSGEGHRKEARRKRTVQLLINGGPTRLPAKGGGQQERPGKAEPLVG